LLGSAKVIYWLGSHCVGFLVSVAKLSKKYTNKQH